MYVARDVGLQVPSDLAVVGYGDTMLSHTWTPPLTTVKQPVAELGEAACSELIRLIQNGEAEDRSAVHLLPTELVVRGSCGGTMLPIGTDVRTGERHAVLGERSMSETAHRGVSRQSRELRGAKEVVPQKRT
jgi:hypothetical protein